MVAVQQPEPEWLTERLTQTEHWRHDQLLAAGFPFLDALHIAEGVQDLHMACELLARGCSMELALRILAD
jgi:hypothetical protein